MDELSRSIEALVGDMPPITLEEMSSIRLMNRTDRKFLTNLPTLLGLLERVRDVYFVQEVEGLRVCPYATVYWDDERRSMYRAHQAGHMPRQKVRVRTYVSSGSSFLEVKRKDNHGKTCKRRIPVPSVASVDTERAGQDFLFRETGLTFDGLSPLVGNRFCRITLVNKAKTERLTIDFDLHFYDYATRHEKVLPNVVVIELKRDGNALSPILPILRELRIKPSGFSKYCIGAAVTLSDLRVNRLKKRLVRIRKVAT